MSTMEMRMAAIEARLAALESARQPSSAGGAQSQQEVATDEDLDSQWGNPEIRFDPKRWTGDSYVGKRMSECPPEYLRSLAGLLDWQARKRDEAGDRGEVDAKGKIQTGHWKRKDAARARGWAARAEASAHRPPPGAGDAWEGGHEF